MTTDTKAVARWDVESQDGRDCNAFKRDDGDYVLFIDHERVVGELQDGFERMALKGIEMRNEIDTFRAELDVLNEAQAVCDGTIPSALLHWHQRSLAAESALAASRAEVEGLREAVGTVCEGWTLPDDARKVLEKALWANTAMEKGNV